MLIVRDRCCCGCWRCVVIEQKEELLITVWFVCPLVSIKLQRGLMPSRENGTVPKRGEGKLNVKMLSLTDVGS